MNSNFRRLGVSELLPRYSFAESLLVRRSVLEIGAVASTGGRSAQFLLARGARTVLACDPDFSAVESAQNALGTPNLRFRPCLFDDLRDGEFDLLLIADLASYVRAPETLVPLIRLLSREGYLVGGLRNPAGLALSQLTYSEGSDAPPTFGQLLDVLGPHFPSVQLATQSPVVAYQLALEEAEGFTIDGSLVDAVEAAYFVAVAGHQPLRPLDPVWVQLPAEPLAYVRDKVEDSFERSRHWEGRAAELEDALSQAQREINEREEQIARFQSQLQQEMQGASSLAVKLAVLEAERLPSAEQDRLARRVRELELELEDIRRSGTSQREREFEWRLQQAQAEVEALELDRDKFSERVQLLEGEAEALRRELNEASERMAQLVAKTDADARALHEVRSNAQMAADRAGEWEQKAMELTGRLREVEAEHEEALRQLEARTRDRAESLEAEGRFLADERKRLGSLVEALEKDRSRLTERVEKASAYSDREMELARMISDRDSRLQGLQARIAAQDAELVALRKALSRVAPNQVQQIYERATAELSAVKAELFRRPAEPMANIRLSSPEPGTGTKPPPPPDDLSLPEEKESKR
jgi:hypothetical protein